MGPKKTRGPKIPKDVWVQVEQDESQPSRPSRRSRGGETSTVKREKDGLTVKVGDMIQLTTKYALVIGINPDIMYQFELECLTVECGGGLPAFSGNELLLSVIRTKSTVNEVVGVIEVKGDAESAGGVIGPRNDDSVGGVAGGVADGAGAGSEEGELRSMTYFCGTLRDKTDTVGSLDYMKMLTILKDGKQSLLDWLDASFEERDEPFESKEEKARKAEARKAEAKARKEETKNEPTTPQKKRLKEVKKTPRKSPTKTPKGSPIKTPKQTPRKSKAYESDDSEASEASGVSEASDSDLDSGSSSSSLSDSDDEFTRTPRKRKVGRPAGSKKQQTKRKKVTDAIEYPDSDDESEDAMNASLEFMQKICGTRKINIKATLSVPDFGSLTPVKPKSGPRVKKVKETEFEDYEQLDTNSTAFKELKKKLHTATKLSSLPCREDEFTSLYLSIENAIKEQTGCCLYVSGTPGIGKTATIKEVMTQMEELHQLGEIEDFKFVELNALKLVTPAFAYSTLWKKISGVQVSPANAALFLEAYFKESSTQKKPIVVMVDELDQMASKTQNVMYNFFNWPTYPDSKLIVLAVANTMDLPERVLSNKISSRLGLKRIQFLGYTYEQLGQIIEHRLDLLTMQNKYKVVVDQDAIRFASRKVASVSGDARKALQICRRAVEIAELEYRIYSSKTPGEQHENVFYVKIPHIAKAINETINSPIAQYITTLSFGSKLILCGVLLRTKRSGLADNPLTDIIEEVNGLLRMAVAKDLLFMDDKKAPVSMEDALLEGNLYGNQVSEYRGGLRLDQFRFLFFELVENGILNAQDVKTERHKVVSLNSSQEEVLSVLRRDPYISTFI